MPEEQQPIIESAVLSLEQLPWYGTLLGAVERAFVLAIQLFLSLLVMQLFTRGQSWWLLVAVSWHAAVDAVALLTANDVISVPAQLAVGVFAVISIAGIYLLKSPEAAEASSFDNYRQSSESIVLEATPEKVEDSRYNR